MKDNQVPIQMVVPNDIIRQSVSELLEDATRTANMAMAIACSAFLLSFVALIVAVVYV